MNKFIQVNVTDKYEPGEGWHNHCEVAYINTSRIVSVERNHSERNINNVYVLIRLDNGIIYDVADSYYCVIDMLKGESTKTKEK